MVKYSSKYTIELWTQGIGADAELIADLTGMVKNRKLVQSRNQYEILTFNIDLDEFEAYCRKLNVRPKDILVNNVIDVRIKRLGTYLAGGELVYHELNITDKGNVISCLVYGYLWLFTKRRTGTSGIDGAGGLVSEVYSLENGTAMSRKDMAWTLIAQSQALVNGDLGITLGPTQATNTNLHEKKYGRTVIKDALQAHTTAESDPIDIWFTYDRKFNTSDYMGSDQPNAVLEFPGNVLNLRVPRDGTDLTNEVIGLGQGALDGTAIEDVQPDDSSQAMYQLRQDVVQTNGSDNSDNGITDKAKAVLALKRVPLNVPAIVVDGGVAPFVTDYGIGDRLPAELKKYSMLEDSSGTYRLEKRTIDVDDDDKEIVTLEMST